MEINANYKIESDSLNCTLFHRAAGTKSWRPIAYYSDPRGCLEKLVKLEINGTGLTDLKTVCKKINELTNLIKSLKIPQDLLEPAQDIAKDKKRGNGRADTRQPGKTPALSAG